MLLPKFFTNRRACEMKELWFGCSSNQDTVLLNTQTDRTINELKWKFSFSLRLNVAKMDSHAALLIRLNYCYLIENEDFSAYCNILNTTVPISMKLIRIHFWQLISEFLHEFLAYTSHNFFTKSNQALFFLTIRRPKWILKILIKFINHYISEIQWKCLNRTWTTFALISFSDCPPR